MELQTRLDARAAALDAAYRASMEEAVQHLRTAGVAGLAKKTGDRAPDFVLPDRDGHPTSLSSLLWRGPVVVSFFRGEWCSFCRLEMEALIEAHPGFVKRGAQLLMVSPQGLTEGLLERTFEVPGLKILRDTMNGVGLQYGLLFRMPDVLRRALLGAGIDLFDCYGNDAWLLPIPATYVVRPDGVIAFAHVDPDFTRRLEPEVILSLLEELSPFSSKNA